MKGKKGISAKQLKRLKRQMQRQSIARSRMMGGRNTLPTAQGVNSKNLKKVIKQAEAQKEKSWVDKASKRNTSPQKKTTTRQTINNPTNIHRLRKLSNYLDKRSNRRSKTTNPKSSQLKKNQALRPTLKGYKARQQFVKMQKDRKAKIVKGTSSKVTQQLNSKAIKSVMNKGEKRFISRAKPQNTKVKTTQKMPTHKGMNKFRQMGGSKMKISPKVKPIKKRIIMKGR